MSDDQGRELRWAPREPRQNSRGRIWTVVCLAVAALVIVGVGLFLLLPRDSDTGSDPTRSPTPAPTATGNPQSPSPAPTEAKPTPSPTALDPGAQLVDDQLASALEDLDEIESAPSDLAQSIIAQLLDGAQRMSDTLAGSADEDAYAALGTYSDSLQNLQTAVSSEADRADDIRATREAVEAFRAALRR